MEDFGRLKERSEVTNHLGKREYPSLPCAVEEGLHHRLEDSHLRAHCGRPGSNLSIIYQS